MCKTIMPAVLIEHGFYTNKMEVKKLLSDDFREKCAVANAKGVLNYLGIQWKENTVKEHWAKEFLDYLTSQGIVETPEAWTDFDGPVTKGAILALIAKIYKKMAV